MKSVFNLAILNLSVMCALTAQPALAKTPGADTAWATVCTPSDAPPAYTEITEFAELSVPESGFTYPAEGFPDCRADAGEFTSFAQARHGNGARQRDLWVVRARLLPSFPRAGEPSLLPLGWQWLEIDRHGGR